MKLKVVDQRGRVVQNLKTRNERRGEGDPRRVVEGDWIPSSPGGTASSLRRTVWSTKTKPIEVRPGFSTGSSCSGFLAVPRTPPMRNIDAAHTDRKIPVRR